MTTIDIACDDLVEIKKLIGRIKLTKGKNQRVIDPDYLTLVGMQILIVSKLEYILKQKGRISNQSDILKIIDSSSLQQLEKDLLKFLYYARHVLVHAGEYADQNFLSGINSLQVLRTQQYQLGSTVTLKLDEIKSCIDTIFKLLREL